VSSTTVTSRRPSLRGGRTAHRSGTRRRLGVSPTHVRVSRTQLERKGLVEIGATGRATVSRVSREDFEEIYAARSDLEGLAARAGGAAAERAVQASIRWAVDRVGPLLRTEAGAE